MPQLDPTYFGPQLFWLFVSFITLFLGMRYLVSPKLNKIFKTRQTLLDEKLSQIQDLENNAEQVSVEAKLRLKEVQEESRKLIQESKAKISDEIIQIKHQLSEESVKQLHQTNDEVKKEIEALKKSLNKEKQDLAATVLENLMGHKVDTKDIPAVKEKNHD